MRTMLIFIVSMALMETSFFTQRGLKEDKDIVRYSFGPQQENKRLIKKEELPEAAKKTLAGDAYKGWTIDKVYKLTNGEFEVELKNAEGSIVVKFDKGGNLKTEPNK